MPDLVLQGLTKRFGDVVAVDDVDLRVKDRELVVVIGPSGCGKTTLLRLIVGLETQNSGSVYVGGRCVDGLGPGERGIQMVFQSLALWPHMKVFDEEHYSNLSFSLKIRKSAQEIIGGIVRDICTRVGVDKKLFSRHPQTLSGGEAQRVAMARSMTTSPKIMLMDEPLSNLDALGRARMRNELKRWHKELGLTTIYVTHNLPEALALADRIAVMNEGRILQIGTPGEVYESSNEFVREFVRAFEISRFIDSPTTRPSY